MVLKTVVSSRIVLPYVLAVRFRYFVMSSWECTPLPVYNICRGLPYCEMKGLETQENVTKLITLGLIPNGKIKKWSYLWYLYGYFTFSYWYTYLFPLHKCQRVLLACLIIVYIRAYSKSVSPSEQHSSDMPGARDYRLFCYSIVTLLVMFLNPLVYLLIFLNDECFDVSQCYWMDITWIPSWRN